VPSQADAELEPLRGDGFRVETVMGMPIGIDLRDRAVHAEPTRTEAVLDLCFALLRAVDDTFSLWRADTPMARLSAGAATLGEMPAAVVEVLRSCALGARETGGWFVARTPDGRVDPTGLVKGWAAARVGRLLLESGYRHWCIAAAGDVLVHGQAQPGEPWTVGIADPDQPGQLLDAVRLGAGAVATSGTGERGGHIWDPVRGRPAHGARSASVLSALGRPDDIIRADLLATAAVARGADAVAWLEGQPAVEALVLTDDGRIESTSGWPAWSVAGPADDGG
jgi:thiamine biosynthesis lipoprotein